MGDRYLRHKTVPVYDDDDKVEDEIDGKRTYDVMEKVESEKYNGDFIVDLDGHELTFERIQRLGLVDPMRVKDKEGLGMTIPDSSNFTISNVRALVGGRRHVDVMECKTQRALEMSMRDFEQYFLGTDRKYIYNVISLEFSQTKMARLIERPKVVDSLDWIDLVWPQSLKQTQTEQSNKLGEMKYPKVQKYCLMSVAGCYTDFHVDFGGTSVWYHILKGGKIFWMIPPTNENLSLYERWVMSGNQGDVFFGDMVAKCQRVELQAGNSLIIPSGWIHAVYTPLDSIVFGGNFLNSFNIPMQLRISQLEERLKVPSRFRFPFFSEVLWYALERYVHCLCGKSFMSEDYKERNIIETSQLKTKNGSSTNDNGGHMECKRQHVHITPYEYKGLKKLVETLELLPQNKRFVPLGIVDPSGLIEAGKSMLWSHSEDDPDIAISGRPKAFWPSPAVKISQTKLPKPWTPQAVKKTSGGNSRVRRVRCKTCESCTRDDCTECVFCKDMRKYGGAGTLKQTCIMRRCQNPILPSTVRDLPLNINTVPPSTIPLAVVTPSPAPEPTLSETPYLKDSSKSNLKRPLQPAADEMVAKSLKLVPESMDRNGYGVDSPSSKVVPRIIVSRCDINTLTRFSIRPAPMTNGNGNNNNHHCYDSQYDKENVVNGLKCDIWMRIFGFLSHKQLAVCMRVNRNFLRWCGHPRFWQHIDVTGKMLTSPTLHCLVRRSPLTLNLSETNVSYRQLRWLLERSPVLRELMLVRCSWAAVAAMATASCPLLTTLDLSWSSGINDQHLKHLLATPTDVRPGQEVLKTRLCFCRVLSLAGTEITDATLKLLTDTLPALKSLDVSFCDVHDSGLGYLAVSPIAETLTTITAQQCRHLTDAAFTHLDKLSSLSTLDVRGCEHVTEAACTNFCAARTQLTLDEPFYFVAVDGVVP